MTIHIEDLKFQCIIGILDFERLTPQDVIINLEIIYTFKENNFINYAEVSELIENTMKTEQFLLIEDALTLLSSKLQETFQAIDTLKLKISKPSIISNCEVGISDTFHFNS